MRRPVTCKQILPRGMLRRAARTDAFREMLVDAVRHQELRILGPAVEFFGELDFLYAERLAVRFGAVLLVRRAIADMAVDDDQRRPALVRVSRRLRSLPFVVGIADVQHVPAEPRKRVADIFGEGDIRAALDGILLNRKSSTACASPRWPASEAASLEIPSIMQPSPHSA